jgi:hypothetical protein
MPTIDQLPPATAASDTDLFMASQGGVVRSVTRAQITSGYQPMFALQSGVVLGRGSDGSGSAESLTVGANLTVNNGTLSANAAPYVVAQLTSGMVPALTDLVPLGQYGYNVAVTYAQFMSGLSGLSGIDASSLLVTPAGSGTAATLASFAAATVMRSGGNMTGPLTLNADPAVPLGAATKQYVDTKVAANLPLSGGTLAGPLTLAGNPTAPLQAVTKQYVDAQAQSALPIGGATLQGPLTLAGDPTVPLNAVTKQYVDGQGFSLEASGAKGDSTTDDTSAINAFLASLPSGARVRVPAGRFYLINSGNLSIPTGVTIEGAAPFANAAHSGLFSGCGFLLNPAFSMVLNYACQLRNLKVLRAGLLSNPAAADVNTAVATWASEALVLTSTSVAAVATSVLSFASTAGVSVGMAIYGKGILPGTSVLSLTSTTVTLSQAVAGSPVIIGAALRFGASIGLLIPPNEGNNVLTDIQLVGFHTGILAMSGEFFASRVQADCITILEATWAGDNAYLREFHCVPYYGIALGNNLNCWRRPGPAFYLHDQTDGWTLCDFFASHWQVGYQLSNVGAVTLIRCGYEKLQDGWANTTGFLWQGHAASCQCFDGYATGAGIGMDMQHTGEVQISAMSTVGATDGTGVAHYRLGTGSYGAIYNAMINEAGPTTPVVVQPNVVRWKLVSPFIDNGSVSPWISIDPTSISSVDLLHVRDTNGYSPSAVETHLHEKFWLTTDPSVATTDGTPQATLTLEATTGGIAAVPSVTFLRSGVGCGAIQTVPTSARAGGGLALSASASGSNMMLVPGGGALVAAIPDGSAKGGAARGAGAVDWQMTRAAATQVASGAAASILGGTGNTAAADHSIAGGNGNSVLAPSGTAFGFNNLISGNASAAPGGANASDRGRVGALIWSSDVTVWAGLRQLSKQILGAFTTDSTPTRLTADSQAASTANTVNMQSWTLYAVRLVVGARHYNSPDAAVWVIDGLLLHCDGGTTGVTLEGGGAGIAPNKSMGSAGSWSIAVAPDNTNSGLAVTVTGAASTPIHWTASVEATEVG